LTRESGMKPFGVGGTAGGTVARVFPQPSAADAPARDGDNAGRRFHGPTSFFATSTPMPTRDPTAAELTSLRAHTRLATGAAERAGEEVFGLSAAGYDPSSFFLGGTLGYQNQSDATFQGRDAMQWWREGTRQVRRPPAVKGIVRYAGESGQVASTIFGKPEGLGEKPLASLPAFDLAAGRLMEKDPSFFTVEREEIPYDPEILGTPVDYASLLAVARRREIAGLPSVVRWDMNASSIDFPLKAPTANPPIPSFGPGESGNYRTESGTNTRLRELSESLLEPAKQLTDWPGFQGAAGIVAGQTAQFGEERPKEKPMYN